MKARLVSLLAVVCMLPSLAIGQRKELPTTGTVSPAVQAHLTAAELLAGEDMSKPPNLFATLLPQAQGFGIEPSLGSGGVAATKAFDQLYYVGIVSVGSWALKTSDGIILFDTLDNTGEAQQYIEGGMKKLGLDPAQIKYIVVTHCHADHFGGAKYLQEKYHMHVLASPADWDVMGHLSAQMNGHSTPPPPAHDMDVTDGQKLTLGDTTVTLYITPGHTPGSVSSIIPVSENGKPHLLSFWGGTGLPQTLGPTAGSGGLLNYKKSLERFLAIGEKAGVDGFIANHHESIYTEAQLNRKPGDPNPWLGESSYIRYMTMILELTNATAIRLEEANTR